MKAKNMIKISVAALGAALCLYTSVGMAGLVASDQIAPQSQLEADKLKIQTYIEREEVRERLQAMGVAESMSKVRIAAMTDEEVHAMAQKIDTMPAGGRLRDSDLVIILLIVLLLLLI